MSSGGVFRVTMLDELRAPLESWLRSNGLVMSTLPDDDPDEFIVVPAPERFAEQERRRSALEWGPSSVDLDDVGP